MVCLLMSLVHPHILYVLQLANNVHICDCAPTLSLEE